MATKTLGMDLVSEAKKPYHFQLEQEGDSRDLKVRIWEGTANSVSMHVKDIPLNRMLPVGYGRRMLSEELGGVMFSVEAFGVLRNWMRMVWDLTA